METKELIDEERSFPGIRRILPQVLCCLVMSLAYSNTYICQTYPIIVVDEFTKAFNTSREDPFGTPFINNFKMNPVQLTLFTSFIYFLQPLASLFAGVWINEIGRKRFLLHLNIPLIFGWIILFFSRNAFWMMFSSLLLGIGMGFMNVAVSIYMPEVIELKLRGVLLAALSVASSFGFLIPHLTFSVVPSWRLTGLILALFPFLSLLLIFLVPESPYWLLIKGDVKGAENSLMKLRGTNDYSQVKLEMDEIKDCLIQSGYYKKDGKPDEQTYTRHDEISSIHSDSILRPLKLLCYMFIVIFASGFYTIMPYLEVIFEEMGVQTDVNKAAINTMIFNNLGNLLTVLVIRYTGKRLLYLSSLIITSVLFAMLYCVNTSFMLSGWKLALNLFYAVSFVSNYGITAVPYIYVSELFPMRGRGIGIGITLGFGCIVGFIFTSSYTVLTDLIGLSGQFLFYSFLNMASFLYFFFAMPETENKTTQEIEQFFQKNKNVNICNLPNDILKNEKNCVVSVVNKNLGASIKT